MRLKNIRTREDYARMTQVFVGGRERELTMQIGTSRDDASAPREVFVSIDDGEVYAAIAGDLDMALALRAQLDEAIARLRSDP